jgi:hypothetical protein
MPKKSGEKVFKLTDLNSTEPFEIEFLWDGESKAMSHLQVGDSIIDVNELVQAIMIIGGDKRVHQMENLTKEQIATFRYYIERKVERSYKEGEVVAFEYEFPVEVWRIEVLLELLVRLGGKGAAQAALDKIK